MRLAVESRTHSLAHSPYCHNYFTLGMHTFHKKWKIISSEEYTYVAKQKAYSDNDNNVLSSSVSFCQVKNGVKVLIFQNKSTNWLNALVVIPLKHQNQQLQFYQKRHHPPTPLSPSLHGLLSATGCHCRRYKTWRVDILIQRTLKTSNFIKMLQRSGSSFCQPQNHYNFYH